MPTARALLVPALSAIWLGLVPVGAQAAQSQPETERLEPADTLEGNYLAAYVAGLSRDTAASAIFYRQALREDPGNLELLERAFVSFLANGESNEAARLAERLAVRDRTNGLAHLALGIRAFKARQFVSVRKQLARGLAGRPDLTATLITAWSWAGSGNLKRALDAVDSLRQDRAYSVFCDYHAGLIAELLGNKAEAERRFKSAYDADRTTLRIVDAYAHMLARRGDTEGALAAYRGFDQLLPRHPIVRDGMERLSQGRPLDPIVSSAADGAAEVLYGLGATGVQQRGDELPAIVYLRFALQLNPDHALALATLADAFERLKRPDLAIELLNRVPANSPLRASAEVQVGLELEQQGKTDEAEKHLQALLEKRPNDVDVLTALGNVLRAHKRWADSAAIYTKAIDQIGTPNASNWAIYYFRGSAYERAKDWAKAEADLKKALELVPDTQPIGKSQVLNYLGYSWVDRNENLDEAFKLLKRAVEMNPRDGMIIDSLGWAYYRFGHYDEAVRELEKAVELKAGDPTINDHLGDAYWKVGRKIEARFQWQHALDANPEPEDRPKIEEKLANNRLDEASAAADGGNAAPATPAPATPVPETPAAKTPAPETPAPATSAPEAPATKTPEPENPASKTPEPASPAPEKSSD